jgi:hypothetical protein
MGLELLRASARPYLPEVQVHLSYAVDLDRALAVAHDQWRANGFDSPVPWELPTPEDYKVVPSRSCSLFRCADTA